MKGTYILSLLLIITIAGYAQNKIAKGYVLDELTKTPIDSAIIAVGDTGIYTYTDVMGYYTIQVPKRRRHLKFMHKDYESQQILLRPGFQHRNLKVYMKSYRSEEEAAQLLAAQKLYKDSLINSYKNVVTLSVLELLAIAIAPRYERFVGFKHSTGMHASFYIYGHDEFNFFRIDYCGSGSYSVSSNYHGFKLAPFYRYYIHRNGFYGVFVEAKIPFGYFDFEEIGYHVSSNNYYVQKIEHDFWTWGAGISIGAMLALPRSKHGVINISIGYQYFPMVDAPEYQYREITNPDGTTWNQELHNHTEYWYMPGPGSTIEIKFLIGGIF